jgi:hypothetical protein
VPAAVNPTGPRPGVGRGGREKEEGGERVGFPHSPWIETRQGGGAAVGAAAGGGVRGGGARGREARG